MGGSQDVLTRDELEFLDNKASVFLLTTPQRSRIMLWFICIICLILILWAHFANIEIVTKGQGKVIPSSQVQVVQSLEGGVIKEILVKEGQRVKKDQILIIIDDTIFMSTFKERSQQLQNLTAESVRINASINSIVVNSANLEKSLSDVVLINVDDLIFSEDMLFDSNTVKRQTDEYKAGLRELENQLSLYDEKVSQKKSDLYGLEEKVKILEQSYSYALKELQITQPLADEGVVPQIEILKMKRDLTQTRNDLNTNELKIPTIKSEIREAILDKIDVALNFKAEQQVKLNEVQDKLAALKESSTGLKDKVTRTIIKSPVNGIVKTLSVFTVGGVISPAQDIVHIVPQDDTLLIEAKIEPKDIAFLRPGLKANVKITAYEFSKFGAIEGQLENISADSDLDDKGASFYRVTIRINNSKNLDIIPGMIAEADIITGKRTILSYFTDPILNATSNSLME